MYSKCECSQSPYKKGKTKTGYQRWYCPKCKKSWSDSPYPKGAQKGNAGRPVRGAERVRQFYLPGSLGDRLFKILKDPANISKIHQLLDSLSLDPDR